MKEMTDAEAAIKLMIELEKGKLSGEKEGWLTLDEIKKEFGLTPDFLAPTP